ncbi:MAG: glycosyltransferase family 4 protein [Thiohalocapsa sp. PB-PSB1]|nr:MAG: glycosyltransferase family 4 protein [Thiohalocapsa sp. PB-PSB1]
MKPVRVLMFARYLPPEYSGAAAQAFLLAERLRARGHHIEFTTHSWSGQRRDYVIEGFAVTALPMRVAARHQEFSIWHNLFKHLWQRRRHVDILHGHGAYYIQGILGPFGQLLGKPSLVKASMSQNDLLSLTCSTIAPVHRRFLKLVDAYVAISDDLNREFLEVGLAPERIWQIPNGVDSERFHPVDREQQRQIGAELGLPVDRPMALFVGVFDQRKRIAWLVQQWIANQGFGTGAHLVAVGPVSRDSYGKALSDELHAYARGHPDLVTIRDFTPRIKLYYQAATLLVFPSSKEGLPNTVLEAMACGLPCVVARAPGSRQLVEDGVNGALFAVDDADDLAQALGKVIGEESVLGARSRQIAVAKYDIEKVADQYECLYDQLLSTHER